MTTSEPAGERGDLIEAMRDRRRLFLRTVAGLTDEQAGLRSTASELCLGGLVHHLTTMELSWGRFMVGGAAEMGRVSVDWSGQFRMPPGATLAGLVEAWAEVAAATDELIATLDLDTAHPLPAAPWFPPGASWSVRRTVLHLLSEVTQHAGHADIIRESIDGARSMG
ncbi:DinB family protein [Micromonospora sp. PLK6-60]|uniref:DinB family protein n=1 Tax=Micromonospora sp. PLK6-60 TaxID=2873383 RepID=UPI001CA735C6|nr:DinB family protein [Micromonospora sp. PLK6-60]MBY8874771.1 DinB family protein [Micromonospora sp. PLK6-60]